MAGRGVQKREGGGDGARAVGRRVLREARAPALRGEGAAAGRGAAREPLDGALDAVANCYRTWLGFAPSPGRARATGRAGRAKLSCGPRQCRWRGAGGVANGLWRCTLPIRSAAGACKAPSAWTHPRAGHLRLRRSFRRPQALLAGASEMEGLPRSIYAAAPRGAGSPRAPGRGRPAAPRPGASNGAAPAARARAVRCAGARARTRLAPHGISANVRRYSHRGRDRRARSMWGRRAAGATAAGGGRAGSQAPRGARLHGWGREGLGKGGLERGRAPCTAAAVAPAAAAGGAASCFAAACRCCCTRASSLRAARAPGAEQGRHTRGTGRVSSKRGPWQPRQRAQPAPQPRLRPTQPGGPTTPQSGSPPPPHPRHPTRCSTLPPSML
jgi:hypothetical protein